MFVGHLAVALGAKKVEPSIPLGAAVAAAFGIDLLWPILLLLGIESVRVSPGDTAFTNLAFESYPWSHSLLAVIGWSIIVGLIGQRLLGSRWAGMLLGGLVLSHWILDLITHRPDLPLWPGGPMAGLGLWGSVPGTIVVEGGLLAIGLWLYLGASSTRDRIGTWALAGLVALSTLIWISQPWAPIPESASAVAMGALVLWLLPPWAMWIEKHRSTKGSPS